MFDRLGTRLTNGQHYVYLQTFNLLQEGGQLDKLRYKDLHTIQWGNLQAHGTIIFSSHVYMSVGAIVRTSCYMFEKTYMQESLHQWAEGLGTRLTHQAYCNLQVVCNNYTGTTNCVNKASSSSNRAVEGMRTVMFTSPKCPLPMIVLTSKSAAVSLNFCRDFTAASSGVHKGQRQHVVNKGTSHQYYYPAVYQAMNAHLPLPPCEYY